MSTTLTQGGEQLWRVPVQWGQQVAVRATTEAASEAELEGICCGVDLRCASSTRDARLFAYANETADETSDGDYGEEPARRSSRDAAAALSQPVRRRAGQPCPATTGSRSPPPPPSADAEHEPLDIPVEAHVAVSGEASGAPTYPERRHRPRRRAEPEGYSPDEPFLVAEGTFSAVASGNPVHRRGGRGRVAHGPSLGRTGLGAVSLACLAVGRDPPAPPLTAERLSRRSARPAGTALPAARARPDGQQDIGVERRTTAAAVLGNRGVEPGRRGGRGRRQHGVPIGGACGGRADRGPVGGGGG